MYNRWYIYYTGSRARTLTQNYYAMSRGQGVSRLSVNHVSVAGPPRNKNVHQKSNQESSSWPCKMRKKTHHQNGVVITLVLSQNWYYMSRIANPERSIHFWTGVVVRLRRRAPNVSKQDAWVVLWSFLRSNDNQRLIGSR